MISWFTPLYLMSHLKREICTITCSREILHRGMSKHRNGAMDRSYILRSDSWDVQVTCFGLVGVITFRIASWSPFMASEMYLKPCCVACLKMQSRNNGLVLSSHTRKLLDAVGLTESRRLWSLSPCVRRRRFVRRHVVSRRISLQPVVQMQSAAYSNCRWDYRIIILAGWSPQESCHTGIDFELYCDLSPWWPLYFLVV